MLPSSARYVARTGDEADMLGGCEVDPAVAVGPARRGRDDVPWWGRHREIRQAYAAVRNRVECRRGARRTEFCRRPSRRVPSLAARWEHEAGQGVRIWTSHGSGRLGGRGPPFDETLPPASAGLLRYAARHTPSSGGLMLAAALDSYGPGSHPAAAHLVTAHLATRANCDGYRRARIADGFIRDQAGFAENRWACATAIECLAERGDLPPRPGVPWWARATHRPAELWTGRPRKRLGRLARSVCPVADRLAAGCREQCREYCREYRWRMITDAAIVLVIIVAIVVFGCINQASR